MVAKAFVKTLTKTKVNWWPFTFKNLRKSQHVDMLSPKLSFFLEKTSPDPIILKLEVPRLGAFGKPAGFPGPYLRGRMYTTSYIWTSFFALELSWGLTQTQPPWFRDWSGVWCLKHCFEEVKIWWNMHGCNLACTYLDMFILCSRSKYTYDSHTIAMFVSLPDRKVITIQPHAQ